MPTSMMACFIYGPTGRAVANYEVIPGKLEKGDTMTDDCGQYTYTIVEWGYYMGLLIVKVE